MKFLYALLFVFGLTAPAAAGQIHLSAAASLKEVIGELADNYGRENPQLRIHKNFGASGSLARQLENGAPGDIFISASDQWVDYLNRKQLISIGTIAQFAGNTVVFAGTPGRIKSMQDLTSLKRIAIGSPNSVPAGEYVMAAIKNAGLEKALGKKLVMAKDVRQCLLYVERGDVDGGFVYRTEALQARQAKIVFIVPQGLYPQVIYHMGLTVAGGRNPAAVRFFSYLKSTRARTVLKRYGFVIH